MARRRGGYNRGQYRYTAARRAALRKAQIESARKRKRNKKIKRVVGLGAVATAGVTGGVMLGRTEGGKNIAKSVKNAGKFGKDLASAFKAVDPHVKETTRKERRVSRARRKKDAAFAATKKNGDRQTVKGISKQDQKDLMGEATKNLGPNIYDPSTYNDDGTVSRMSPGEYAEKQLSDKGLRSGIARNSRARARAGGQGMTRAEKNKLFKGLEKSASTLGTPTSNPTVPTSGLKPRGGSSRIPRDPYDYRTALDDLKSADEALLSGVNQNVVYRGRTNVRPYPGSHYTRGVRK